MNKQALEAVVVEMAGHLQAALTAIEVALLTGSVEMLPAARAEIVAGWDALGAAAAPALAGGGNDRPER